MRSGSTRSSIPGRWSGTVSAEADDPIASVSAPAIDSSRAIRALRIVLNITAGCTDIIGFLGLNRLFTAHITGDLVILAAHIVDGCQAQLTPVLTVSAF